MLEVLQQCTNRAVHARLEEMSVRVNTGLKKMSTISCHRKEGKKNWKGKNIPGERRRQGYTYLHCLMGKSIETESR